MPIPLGMPVFVSWSRGQGRTQTLAHELAMTPAFLATRIESPRTAPLRWVGAAWRTWRLLRRERPAALVVTLPPLPAALVCFRYAKRARIPLVLDLHGGVFTEPRWRWALRPTIALARRSTACVVTNEAQAAFLREHRVAVVVLDDPPDAFSGQPLPVGRGGGGIVVPMGWAQDEPVAEIVAAAGLLGCAVTMTGLPPAGSGPVDSAAVRLSGWLTPRAYRELLAAADVVLCLTTRQDTMQRGAYEAMALHQVLVTSDTAVLREYFQQAAVYVKPEAAAIAAGVWEALATSAARRSAMLALHGRRTSEWDAQLAQLEQVLGLTPRL